MIKMGGLSSMGKSMPPIECYGEPADLKLYGWQRGSASGCWCDLFCLMADGDDRFLTGQVDQRVNRL